MKNDLINGFCWREEKPGDSVLKDEEKYKAAVDWAFQARCQNPAAFDKLTEWLLDDEEWTDEKLEENEQILMQGILGRFRAQNDSLRQYLKELEPSGLVNTATFGRLDNFDAELSGNTQIGKFRDAVAHMFSDFSSMKDKNIRKQIAGGITGPAGTCGVDFFGYINLLKDCDMDVQFTLFMPDVAKSQQKGFKVDHFEYKKMPAMRFIGKESIGDLSDSDMQIAADTMRALDSMTEYKSGFDYDVLFIHHFGITVDLEHCHPFWGRFMKADTPVPEGFLSFDFVPKITDEYEAGLPYISQFAYAVFSGDKKELSKKEGYDVNAMYDVTRNIILGQGVLIPYPEKYWTAEVFLDGYANGSSAFMFSVEL